MVDRVTDDRRVKKVKVAHDKRKIKRRQEDVDNVKTYYGVLGVSIFIFTLIGLLSFIWGN